MSDGQHPVDDLLRNVAGRPKPSLTDREYAEQKLSQEIARATQRGRWMRRGPALAWMAGVLGVVIVIIVGLQTTQPTPAAATMEEIAAIVDTVDPLTATDTHYVYTRSTAQNLGFVPRDGLGGVPYDKDLLVYQAHSTRETWYGIEGTVQIRTTYHPPTFFTDTDRDVYYAAGLDQQDQIGRTMTTTDNQPIEDWPTNPDQLDETIRDQVVTDRGLPESVEYLNVAFDVIGESFAAPQVRAATLRLIGNLDGLTLVDENPDGTATFTVDYTDSDVDTSLTFTIDRNGYLRRHQILNLTADTQFGIPANTPIYQAEFSEPLISQSLG